MLRMQGTQIEKNKFIKYLFKVLHYYGYNSLIFYNSNVQLEISEFDMTFLA